MWCPSLSDELSLIKCSFREYVNKFEQYINIWKTWFMAKEHDYIDEYNLNIKVTYQTIKHFDAQLKK